MGWNAPTDVKHADLGEIPGIRELSDEERKKLEANDPNEGLHAIKKNLKKREAAVAESLLEDYDQLAMDVGNFLDAWIETPDPNSPEYNLLAPTLYQDIIMQLVIAGESYAPDDVYDIALRRGLHPMMFYYGVNIGSDGKPYIVITLRDDWDENKTLTDPDIISRVAPDFLIYTKDSKYKLAEDMSPSEARREMIKQAFVEKHEVAGL